MLLPLSLAPVYTVGAKIGMSGTSTRQRSPVTERASSLMAILLNVDN